MSDTLVLDKAYQPLYTTDWKDAMRLWMLNKADVLTEDEERLYVRSEDFEMGMPRVVKLRNYVAGKRGRRRNQRLPFNRRNLVTRDSVIIDGKMVLICQYCGGQITTQSYSMDHVLPRSRGGLSEWTNIVVSCKDCNFRKANKTPEEAGMRLLKKPVEPSIDDPKYRFKLHINNPHPSWKSWLYWNVELEK